MRTLFLLALSGVALSCASLTGGCTSLAGASGPSTVGFTPRPYDLALVADQRLLSFERTHPQCDLWTDWRKICSRMGPNGETTCRTDPYYPAKPSEPFCADYERPNQDTLPEALSRGRFCNKFNDAIPGQVQPVGAHFCARYQVLRPFNGTSVSQFQTPDCLEWAYSLHRFDETKTCLSSDFKEGGKIPSCFSPEVRSRQPEVAFECIKWSSSAYCKYPVAGRVHEIDTGVSLLIPPPPQTIRPVWGVYCSGNYIRPDYFADPKR